MSGLSLLDCSSSPFDVSTGVGSASATTTATTGSGEGDANSALAELDQGLRCGRLGEQCEAIVRFPRLFAKYPFPILINSALLKLADVFRQGSNFVRLCVLRVAQQSRRHLDKITNVDEFVKRIFTVLHSNDPVARALTLRTLGAIASIIPERKQVHHHIRSALDSHDDAELHAAIFAAGQFAAQSKTFSVNMCSKISVMVARYETPLSMKIRLVPIFQHMHHDTQTAQVVRRTCIDMLPDYPSEDFVCVTLHTLTLLAAHTLVDIPEQVELLLAKLYDDPRAAVKTRVIKDLMYLANADHAHLWTMSNASSVISFASYQVSSSSSHSDDVSSTAVLVGSLSVLCSLVEHTSVDKLDLGNFHSAEVLKLCADCCYQREPRVAVRATQLLCALAASCKREMHRVEGYDIAAEAAVATESLFLILNSGAVTASIKVLQECLKCIVTLCRAYPEVCDQFVDVVGGTLQEQLESSRLLRLLAELLAALANLKHGVLSPLIPEITTTVKKLTVMGKGACSADGDEQDHMETLSLLCTALFQTHRSYAWSGEAAEAVSLAIQSTDPWTVYRIGRAAARYGNHVVAAEAFGKTADSASSEQMYFWIRGLAKIFKGESVANDGSDPDMVERATKANELITLGATAIKAATSQTRTQEFQINYLKCRCSFLECISQLLLFCNSLRTSPPPAIAGSQAKQSKDDLARCGRVAQLLRRGVRDLQACANALGGLAESCFDADPATLAHLRLWRRLCSSLAQWTEMTCLRGSLQGSMYEDTRIEFLAAGGEQTEDVEECGIEIQTLLSLGENLASIFRPAACASTAPSPITDFHMDCLYRACAVLLAAPVGYPRLFFQSLQRTTVKLAVTPQPRAAGEPVTAAASQQLAVKVEGVVTTTATSNSGSSRSWRRAQSVHISLVCTQSNKPNNGCSGNSPSGDVTLEQCVKPHNDFFSAQFLVPLSCAGAHSLTVDTRLADEEGKRWNAGQRVTLNVKAFEDGQARMQAARTLAVQQQQR